MSLPVRLLPLAESDIDQQAYYYLTHANVKVFERFHQAVLESLELLSGRPEIGERLSRFSTYYATVRIWRISGFGEHLIIYRQVDGGIEVVRVLHGKRDIEKLLP